MIKKQFKELKQEWLLLFEVLATLKLHIKNPSIGKSMFTIHNQLEEMENFLYDRRSADIKAIKILEVLEEAREPISRRTLAAELGCNSRAIAYVLKQLIADGKVKRMGVNLNDPRGKYVLRKKDNDK